MSGKTVSGLYVCERERERARLRLLCWRKKEKPLSEGTVLLLIYCMPVEKGSLAGFLSALLKKSLLSKAFTALNVKISITAHSPEVSEEADW